jgi:hypothetical protein
VRDDLRVRSISGQDLDAPSCFVRCNVLSDVETLSDRFRDGPVRDALAVRKASTADNLRSCFEGVEECLNESRLADPGLANNDTEATRGRRGASEELSLKGCELGFASHDGRVEPSGTAWGMPSHRLESVGPHGLGLSLGGDRLNPLRGDRVAHELEGQGAQQDPVGWGRLLETSGGVHCVARDERAARSGVAGDDLPGVHSGSVSDRDPELPLELHVQPGNGRSHLGGSAHGSQGVVLVSEWDAEDRHDRVTDELLHGPAVSLEGSPEDVEIASHDRPHRFGVEVLADGGGTRHVREHDGHDFACFGWPRGTGKGGSTHRAEAELGGAFVATGGAGDHVGILGRSRQPSALI